MGILVCCEAWRLTSIESLSIHVTFTAIVLGAYPGRPKCAKSVLKWRTFGLSSWITGKRLKIDGYMLRCVWQEWILFLSMHRRNVRGVPVRYPLLFGLRGTVPPLFRTQVKNLLSPEAICEDQITQKPFSAPPRTPSPESSCLVSFSKHRQSLREGFQG